MTLYPWLYNMISVYEIHVVDTDTDIENKS